MLEASVGVLSLSGSLLSTPSSLPNPPKNGRGFRKGVCRYLWKGLPELAGQLARDRRVLSSSWGRMNG